ncbi:MAG: electron transport complex subunit RsxC [Oscillospiraceae bacterium]|jgi:electron transport complex protein RnfC|nr:electron transport complex subunit RsxC [Oscillospiraceae bacterium]
MPKPKKSVVNFRGGIHPAGHKRTAECATVDMPPPELVTIPMQQHIGAACQPMVKPGETVYLGQRVGDTDAFVAAPIHASVSGTVKKIGELMLPSGQRTQTVVIESDGLMTPHPKVVPHTISTPDELAGHARRSGLVGFGGAGFPAHVKLRPVPGKPIDTIIINAAECEPFITSDYRECMENTFDVLNGINLLIDVLKPGRVAIALEDNKPKATELFGALLLAQKYSGGNIDVTAMKTRYPQGAEKMICYTVTGRIIPAGALPADVGCMIVNVSTVGFLYRYVQTGMPLISKRITLDGSAVKSPCNVRVPIGTSVREVVEFCGGYRETPKKLLSGGPMMGMALTDDSFPILKQSNAILAFNDADAAPRPIKPCFRCGQCVKVCPMRIMPTMVSHDYDAKNIEGLKRAGITACMECGSCAYSCPANRPLVQYIRMSKELIKKS